MIFLGGAGREKYGVIVVNPDPNDGGEAGPMPSKEPCLLFCIGIYC